MIALVEHASILDRPLYGMGQVDSLLGLHSGTAKRWIDGYTRDKTTYPPVVRLEHTGSDVVTWGEFIETSLLAQYRDAHVPLQRLRPVVQYLREELGVPYPLATETPWAGQRDLILHAQKLVGLEEELLLAYAPRTGQTALTDRAMAFFVRVRWPTPADGPNDAAAAFSVEDGSPVVLDPLRSFGAPTVDGIRTDIIAELVTAGDSEERVARVYDLTPKLVRAAVDYERRRAA